MQSNGYKIFFVFMLMVLSTSCGFHLRGAVDLSATITPVFLEISGVDNGLQRELKALLSAASKNSLANSESEAKTILLISSIRKKQRVMSLDNRGRAREYELNYQFNYQLKKIIGSASSSEIIKTNTIKLKRDLLFDPDSVLAVSYERDALYNDMQKDAARLVLRQLAAIKK